MVISYPSSSIPPFVPKAVGPIVTAAPMCAAPHAGIAMLKHIARFPECPTVVASREFTCLDTTSTTTGTLRASCAIWRETVGIGANR